MRAQGSMEVDVHDSEVAHLFYTAGVFYHIIANEKTNFNKWASVKMGLVYPTTEDRINEEHEELKKIKAIKKRKYTVDPKKVDVTTVI